MRGITTGQALALGGKLTQLLPTHLSFDLAQEWIGAPPSVIRSFLENLRRGTNPFRVLADFFAEGFEFYVHPEQEVEGMVGYQLFQQLMNTDRLGRAHSSRSGIVHLWLSEPAFYPDEFKDKAVTLWGYIDKDDKVAILTWGHRMVRQSWHPLSEVWYGSSPALLKPVV
mgnify:CR=1 FL=1